MANYKIIIQYDGTRYKGWQRQKTTDQTIQGKIEAILSRQYGRTIEIDGSGRTDAGVHAHGQVANFRLPDACCAGKTPEELCEELRQIFVQYLPEDIAVTEVRAASERFHSRLNVVKKTYVYRIWNADYPNVFERKYMLHDNRPMDVEAMRQAAQYLLGKHDFAAFCGNAKMKKSTVRTIHEIDIRRIGEEIRWIFTEYDPYPDRNPGRCGMRCLSAGTGGRNSGIQGPGGGRSNNAGAGTDFMGSNILT